MNRYTSMALSAMLAALVLPNGGALAQAAPATAPRPAASPRENVEPAVRAELLQVIERWRQAVIQGDRAGLERAYHDALSYGHTDGEILGKRQQIARTLEPGRKFTAIDLRDVAVRQQGNVALVTSRIAFHVARDGSESVSDLAGLDVWTRGPGGWQLIARQLTRLPK